MIHALAATLLLAQAPATGADLAYLLPDGSALFVLSVNGVRDPCFIASVSIAEGRLVGGAGRTAAVNAHDPRPRPCALRSFLAAGPRMPFRYPSLAARPGARLTVKYEVERREGPPARRRARARVEEIDLGQVARGGLAATAKAIDGGVRFEFVNRSSRPILIGIGTPRGGGCGAPEALLAPGETFIREDTTGAATAAPISATIFDGRGGCLPAQPGAASP